MACQYCIRYPGREIKDLQRRIIGRRQKFCITRCPGETPNSIVMCVVNSFDVVEVGPPVLDITLLPA